MELYLIHHFESIEQLIPIIFTSLVLVFVILLIFFKNKSINLIYKYTLVLTTLSGFYGVFLHLNANYEFEVDMAPTASTADLLLESLSGALPALAPLSMVVLALLGYAYLILINQKNYKY